MALDLREKSRLVTDLMAARRAVKDAKGAAGWLRDRLRSACYKEGDRMLAYGDIKTIRNGASEITEISANGAHSLALSCLWNSIRS